MKRGVNELAWRTRLASGLAVLGAFSGAAVWAWHLGGMVGVQPVGLVEWARWFWVLIEKGFGGELASAAAAGAVLLAVPALWLVLRRGRRSRPPQPDAGRKPLKPL